MPRMLYSCGEEYDPRTIRYSDLNKKIAICPSCNQVDSLTPISQPTPGDIEHAVSWFRCECGEVLKLDGFYRGIKV